MIDISTGKQMTRGGFLKGILASGIAPSISMGLIANAGSANANVRGAMRNVGARQAAMFEWGDKIPTARDYVHENLLAMWDGIENDGFDNPHNPSASNWYDLSGKGQHITSFGSFYSFGNNCVNCLGKLPTTNIRNYYQSWTDYNSIKTVECVFSWVNSDSDHKQIMSFRSTNGIGAGIFISGNYMKYGMNDFSRKIAITKDGTIQTVCTCRGTTAYKNGVAIGTAWDDANEYTYSPKCFCGYSPITPIGCKIYAIRLYTSTLNEDQIISNQAIDIKRFGIA